MNTLHLAALGSQERRNGRGDASRDPGCRT
jgi:hypothetical protein